MVRPADASSGHGRGRGTGRPAPDSATARGSHRLQSNLVDLAGRYGKNLIVAETAYPWTLANGEDLTNILSSRSQLPDATIWPPTLQGQLAYFTALRGGFSHVPGGHGLGFMSWEPEWIPGVGWTPGQGNPNDNLTLFDFRGRALPALGAFTPGRMSRPA